MAEVAEVAEVRIGKTPEDHRAVLTVSQNPDDVNVPIAHQVVTVAREASSGSADSVHKHSRLRPIDSYYAVVILTVRFGRRARRSPGSDVNTSSPGDARSASAASTTSEVRLDASRCPTRRAA